MNSKLKKFSESLLSNNHPDTPPFGVLPLYSHPLVSGEEEDSRRSTKVRKSGIRWGVDVALHSDPHTHRANSSAVDCLEWGWRTWKGLTSERGTLRGRCLRACMTTSTLSAVISTSFTFQRAVYLSCWTFLPLPSRCCAPFASRTITKAPSLSDTSAEGLAIVVLIFRSNRLFRGLS